MLSTELRVRRSYTETTWGQLHVKQCGDSGPWVVLFHESPRSSMVYDPVLPLLGSSVRALAVDTPGYGQSDGPDETLPMEAYAEQVLAGLDALGIDEFVPVGMKTGSYLASAIALQAGPGRVKKAVLYAVERFDPATAAHWSANWAPAVEFSPDGSHLMKLWDKYVGLYGTGSPRDLSASIGEILLEPEHYGRIYPAAFGFDGWSAFEELVARGTKVTVFEPQGIRMTHDIDVHFEQVPGTEVVSFDVTGHLGTRVPEQFTEAVLRAVHA